MAKKTMKSMKDMKAMKAMKAMKDMKAKNMKAKSKTAKKSMKAMKATKQQWKEWNSHAPDFAILNPPYSAFIREMWNSRHKLRIFMHINGLANGNSTEVS